MNPSIRPLMLFPLLCVACAPAQPARSSATAVDEPTPYRRLPRLVMADYAYGYQADPRRGAALRVTRLAGGSTDLAHHPWEGEGPWFSSDRPMWHRSQLEVMHGAGIDVALVAFRGGAADRRAGSLRGFDALVQALKESRSAPSALHGRGRDHPQIAPCVDLGSLAEQFGGSVDLKDPEAQRSLYGILREFTLRVPEPFRATVQRESAGQWATACIVQLTGAQAVRDADPSFVAYCERRFLEEFGCGIFWIGPPELRARLPGLDGFAADRAAAAPARFETGARVRTACLGPGFESALAAGDGARSREAIGEAGRCVPRSRQNGSAYIADWRAAMEARPDWVVLDSWNDFTRGSELAPTLEYGLQYRDLTRGATMQFKETPAALRHAGTILSANVPRHISTGAIYPVEVLVRNDGSEDWNPFTQISLSYRWLKEGRQVSDLGPATAASQPRGESRLYTMGLTAPMQAGRALPEGDYELQVGLIRRAGTQELWLEEEALLPYRATVRVGAAPSLRPRWLGSDMPVAARSGSVHRATVRLRNDGSQAWLLESGAALAYRWRRVSSFLRGYADDGNDVVAESERVALPVTVLPGRVATVTVPVGLVDRQGKPLPLWTPAQNWSYVLEWDLWDGKAWASQSGATTLREVVEAVDRDPGQSFIGCNLPSELAAGRLEKVTLGLRNLGPETWKAGRDRIAVHWYFLDGTEAAWMDSELPLPEDVLPYSEQAVKVAPPAARAPRPAGRTSPPPSLAEREAVVQRDLIVRDVPVRVPDYFGPLYCVFDLVHDGQPASTAAGNKGTDILVVPVNVYSPRYLPLPLTAFFDTDGISSDLNRADGDIDGRGNSLPAERMPPYVTRPAVGSGPSPSPIYPCGLWVRGLNAPGGDRATFLYPGKADRIQNMIACAGQRLPLVAAPRVAVHLLAVGTSETSTGEFRLVYADAATDSRSVTVTHFSDPPKNGEHAAFAVAHRHTQRGDDPGTRCYLIHHVLPANSQKALTALELPRDTGIKVIAITLESPSSLPANP